MGIGVLVLLIFVAIYFFGLERDATKLEESQIIDLLNFEQGNSEFSQSQSMNGRDVSYMNGGGTRLEQPNVAVQGFVKSLNTTLSDKDVIEFKITEVIEISPLFKKEVLEGKIDTKLVSEGDVLTVRYDAGFLRKEEEAILFLAFSGEHGEVWIYTKEKINEELESIKDEYLKYIARGLFILKEDDFKQIKHDIVFPEAYVIIPNDGDWQEAIAKQRAKIDAGEPIGYDIGEDELIARQKGMTKDEYFLKLMGLDMEEWKDKGMDITIEEAMYNYRKEEREEREKRREEFRIIRDNLLGVCLDTRVYVLDEAVLKQEGAKEELEELKEKRGITYRFVQPTKYVPEVEIKEDGPSTIESKQDLNVKPDVKMDTQQ